MIGGRRTRRDAQVRPAAHKQRPVPAPPSHQSTAPSKPAWQELLDPQERPSREDLDAQHNVFLDSMLEPVPLPRWLRGKRRPPRDKLS
jgi:hypothetical protein